MERAQKIVKVTDTLSAPAAAAVDAPSRQFTAT